MNGGAIYSDTRARLLARGTDLDAAQAATSVPALPGWTVRDTYAHLTGISSDVLNDRMDDAGGDAWTARQVGERRHVSLADVCGEWDGDAPAFDTWLAGAGSRGLFCVFDLWAHSHDIRGALGEARPGPGDAADGSTATLVEPALAVFDRRFREAGAPALAVVAPSASQTLGEGEPGGRLATDDYTLLRILFGRRSRDQITAEDWDGDPDLVIDHLHLFPLPVADLVD
jgi:uncharacterized protein (TIGR03083 family)